jgi:AraC-like DNA-binding protein
MDGFIRDIKLVSGARRRLDRHFHEEYSLAFLHSGTSHARLAGGELPVSGGDLVLMPPRLVHACNPDEGEEWSYSIFYLEPSWVEGLLGWRAPPIQALRLTMAPGFGAGQARIAGARQDPPALESLVREALGTFAGAPQGAAGAAARLGLAPASGAGARAPSSGLDEAKRHLEAHLAAAVSVDELAEVAGLSKYRFIRAFSGAYGLTPHAYLLNVRVNRAKRQLSAGEGIAAAAYENGFCDQSHFSRAFASRVGITPGAYAAR